MERFLVVVSQDREQRFWVEAEDRPAAQELGNTLSEELDSAEWEITDLFVDVMPERHIQSKPQPTDVIWRYGAWEIVGDGSDVQHMPKADPAGQSTSGD